MLPQQKMLAGSETGYGARRISSSSYIKTSLRFKPVVERVVLLKVPLCDRARIEAAL
jgi:hypothetical protein